MSAINKINILSCCLLVGLVFFIYGQTIKFEFINFDDQDYVTENEIIKKGLSYEGLKWAFSFTENDLTYWHPLAYIAHMADCQFFGIDSGRHHLSNSFLHAVNTVLFFFLCFYMTGSRRNSIFAACLMAVHPVCVDSVAWISQKKTLLATMFFLLAVLSYVRYTRKNTLLWYFITCFFLVAGLMSKPLLVTFPFILLIFDFWPLNRFNVSFQAEDNIKFDKVAFIRFLKRITVEKIPMLIPVCLWCITPFFQKHVTAKNISFEVVSLSLRIKNAFVSYFSYLKKFFFPFDLAFLYPYPDHVSFISALSAVVALVLITLVFLKLYRNYPFLISGWFLFILSLIPFSGLVQGAVWPSFADRFAYMPFMGLYIAFSWGTGKAISGFYNGRAVFIFYFLVISLLTVISFNQTGVWKDNISLYTHALNVTKRNYLAHNNSGIAYDERNEMDKAENEYLASLSIKPGFSKAHHNLAVHYLKRGETDKAKDHFKLSLMSNPDNPVAKYNLAIISEAEGDISEAEALYRSAISDKPDFSDAHNNLGALFLRKGDKKKAFDEFRLAISYDPENIGALSNLGNEFFETGRFRDAEMCFLKALSIDPENVKVLNDLGVLYGTLNRLKKAEENFLRVLASDPDNKFAHDNLELIIEKKGRLDIEASKACEIAEKQPDDIKKQLECADLVLQKGEFQKAETIYLNTLTAAPSSIEALIALAGFYENSGQYDKAVIYYTRLAETNKEKRKEASYLIGAMHAMMNRPDDSVKWLQKAADSGFTQWSFLRSDHRFDNIRKTRKFNDFLNIVSVN